METARARELLRSERIRVQQLIGDVAGGGRNDRIAANQSGDMFDSAQPLTEEGTDEAVLTGLQDRLVAISRAGRTPRCRILWLLGSKWAADLRRTS